MKARVEQHPETAALALALAPPLGGRVRGNTYDDAPGLEVVSNSIEPAFFEVMEIPLMLGRTFQSGDDPETTVIISRTLAMAMYGSLDVLGRGFPRSKPAATIVGVAGDAHSIRVGGGQHIRTLSAAGGRGICAGSSDRRGRAAMPRRWRRS